MSGRRTGPRPGLVPLVLAGACLLGVLWLWLLPGFRVQAATPFGETARVELSVGDHTVYADTDAAWSEVRCEGTGPDGEDVGLRVSMSQQDLLVPRHWRAQSSFASDAGTVTLTCRSQGTTTVGTFAVGPSVDLPQAAFGTVLFAAAVMLGIVAIARARRRP